MPKPRYGWHGQKTTSSWEVGSRWKLTSKMVLEILPWVDIDGSSPDTHVRCKVVEEAESRLIQAFCPKGSEGYWSKQTLEEYQDE